MNKHTSRILAWKDPLQPRQANQEGIVLDDEDAWSALNAAEGCHVAEFRVYDCDVEGLSEVCIARNSNDTVALEYVTPAHGKLAVGQKVERGRSNWDPRMVPIC